MDSLVLYSALSSAQSFSSCSSACSKELDPMHRVWTNGTLLSMAGCYFMQSSLHL